MLLSPNSKVVTDKGIFRVNLLEGLVRGGGIYYSVPCSYDKGKTGRNRIFSIRYTECLPELLLETEDGFTLRAAAETKLFLLNGHVSNIELLQPGDKILLQNTYNHWGIKKPPGFKAFNHGYNCLFDLYSSFLSELADDLFQSPADEIMFFLKGFFYENLGKVTAVQGTNLTLLQDVQILLLNLGIKTTLSKVSSDDENRFTLTPQSKDFSSDWNFTKVKSVKATGQDISARKVVLDDNSLSQKVFVNGLCCTA